MKFKDVEYLKKGMKCTCSLDGGSHLANDYTGIINSIQKDFYADGEHRVDIERDDGASGSGTNRTWNTIIKRETAKYLIVDIIRPEWDTDKNEKI